GELVHVLPARLLRLLFARTLWHGGMMPDRSGRRQEAGNSKCVTTTPVAHPRTGTRGARVPQRTLDRSDLRQDPLDRRSVPAPPLLVLRRAHDVDQAELLLAGEDRGLERNAEEVEERREGRTRP